jgi:hypothetical protein
MGQFAPISGSVQREFGGGEWFAFYLVHQTVVIILSSLAWGQQSSDFPATLATLSLMKNTGENSPRFETWPETEPFSDRELSSVLRNKSEPRRTGNRK